MPIYEIEAPDGRMLEIEGEQPPSEVELDKIFASVGVNTQPLQIEPQYQRMSFKQALKATPEQLNENIKQLGAQRLQQRQNWEQKHPVVSEFQKAFQPNYRAGLIDMQNQAKYGMQVPIGQKIKGDIQKTGQQLVPSTNLAVGLATGGGGFAKGFFPSIGKAMGQGAIQGGVEAITRDIADNGLNINTLGQGLQGAGIGSFAGGAVPILSKPIGFGAKATKRFLNGLWTGSLENMGISKNSFDRMRVSPRGTDISEHYEQFGSNDFITGVAEKFKNGIQQLRNQEIVNFAKARDNLIAQNKDVAVDLTPFTQKAFNKIKTLGFIDDNGLTPAGKNTTNLTKFIEDLQYYNSRPFDISELQTLKSDVLDNIIDYAPQAGQKLNKPTRALQNVAKEMRKDINNVLNETLGTEYSAINSKLSEVLDLIDNNPELKDLTNAQSLDTLTGKLKRTGTVRTQTAKELQKLEQIMNENGINISDYSLLDDILDYTAAKEINTKVNTGLSGGVANLIRRPLGQPLIEGVVNTEKTLLPILNTLKTIGNKAKPINTVLQSPSFYSGLSVPVLQGGVEYNEYR